MRQLVARFDIQLSDYLLVNRPEEDKLRYETRINDFDVEILLISDGGFRAKQAGEEHFSFCISRALISVARNEQIAPPPVCSTDHGQKDYSVQSSYFEERLPKYQNIALEVLKRIILFFKYRLHNPLLREPGLFDKCFLNPKWVDETGQEVGKGPLKSIASAIPGLSSSSFGVRKLITRDDCKLQRALQTQVRPELHEEFLSDAQEAIFQNKFHRAILEMAIACEVAVKHAFFAKPTTAGEAYEYLEDKGRINIRFMEILDGVAKHAFGESFREVNSSAYKDIDNLFRCRNKVAHRGKVVYRDDAGVHGIDLSTLEKWWQSVEVLLDWLHNKQTGLNSDIF